MRAGTTTGMLAGCLRGSGLTALCTAVRASEGVRVCECPLFSSCRKRVSHRHRVARILALYCTARLGPPFHPVALIIILATSMSCCAGCFPTTPVAHAPLALRVRLWLPQCRSTALKPFCVYLRPFANPFLLDVHICTCALRAHGWPRRGRRPWSACGARAQGMHGGRHEMPCPGRAPYPAVPLAAASTLRPPATQNRTGVFSTLQKLLVAMVGMRGGSWQQGSYIALARVFWPCFSRRKRFIYACGAVRGGF